MTYSAVIKSVNNRIDGFDVTFDVVNEDDEFVATHTQGFANQIKRKPIRGFAVVADQNPQRPGDQQVIEVDAFEDTDEWETPPREVIEEAIRNFIRDVVPNIVAQPPIEAGDKVELE